MSITFVLEFFDNVKIYYFESVHVVQMLNQMDINAIKMAKHHVQSMDQFQQKKLSKTKNSILLELLFFSSPDFS